LGDAGAERGKKLFGSRSSNGWRRSTPERDERLATANSAGDRAKKDDGKAVSAVPNRGPSRRRKLWSRQH
jgi:hypothetical protein